MLRYYVLATLLVALLGSIFIARERHRAELRVASVQVTVPPKVTDQARDGAGHGPSRFTATGDWIMSALPSCFVQRERRSGPLPFVRAAVPSGALRIAAGTRFVRGACRVLVRADDVIVERGADRMRVSPPAELYRSGAALILVRPAIRGAGARIFDPPGSSAGR